MSIVVKLPLAKIIPFGRPFYYQAKDYYRSAKGEYVDVITDGLVFVDGRVLIGADARRKISADKRYRDYLDKREESWF